MLAAGIEERHDFIKYVACCDEFWKRRLDLLPMLLRLCMMLVTLELKRKDIAGIEEHRAHRS